MRSELRFLHSTHNPHCAAVVDKHFDGYHTLQFMTRGAIHLRYGDAHHELEGSWYWPAMPGPHIRFRATEKAKWWDHRYVAFQGPLVDRWIDAGIFPAGPVRCEDPPAHAERFDRLLAAIGESLPWSRLSAINQLERILIDLAELSSRPGSSDWLERARALLSEDVDQPVDHHAIAAALGVGYSTFRRRFTEQTGTTPHAFRIGVRIARARAMLAETDAPIKSIAERLGYSDVFYFARQFRAETGLPPRAYRLSAQR